MKMSKFTPKAYRAAIYARSNSSSDEQLRVQLQAARGYADNNGMPIVAEYVDKTYSGVTDERPAFQQMISDSANDLFDVLIVADLARFSRKHYDIARYQRMMRAYGVELISAAGQFSYAQMTIPFGSHADERGKVLPFRCMSGATCTNQKTGGNLNGYQSSSVCPILFRQPTRGIN